MRVLVDGSPLCDLRRTAGIGHYADGLIKALIELDAADIFVSKPWSRPPREQWPVRFLNAQPAALAGLRHRPGIVHSLASDPILVFPLTRQVATVHDVVPWTDPGVSLRRPVRYYLARQRRRLRRCGAIITDSAAVREDVIETLAIEPPRVHVVPIGVSEVFTPTASARDDALRRSVGVPAAGYVLWVGSLSAWDPRKALDVLVEALAGAPGESRPLVLAGRLGGGSRRLETLAAERGVPVILPGYVEDEVLAALYRGAAVATLPSLHEGFGIPALEALASGTPLVATSVGNLPELVGEAGILVASGNPRDLAEAIQRVALDDSLRSRLRAAGPVAARPYTWRRTAELTVEVYRGLTG